MNHVEEIWTERVVRRVKPTNNITITNVLVVVTDLLTDLDIVDFDALDYVEEELRRQHREIDEIRFVPLGRRSDARLVAEVFALRGSPVEAVPTLVVSGPLGNRT